MITFLIGNVGTIIVGAIVFAVVAAIVVKMVRDVKMGKPIGCDCGCSQCPHSGACSTHKS